MRAKVTNVSAWQSVPLSGTLDISIPQRYVDSSGNATVRHYSGVLRLDGLDGPRWVNALNPNEDLWVVVQGPTDPVGPLATFNEILSYGPQSDVRTTFNRRLVSSDLNGLFFDYAQPAPVNPAGFGTEPLSMQAARQLLNEGPAVFDELGLMLADIRQGVADIAQSAAYANGLTGIASQDIYTESETPGTRPDGTQGIQYKASGLWTRIKRVAGNWVDYGSPMLSALGLKLRSGYSLLDYESYVVAGDWIPAINVALLDGDVIIPRQTLTVKPAPGNYIKWPTGTPRTLRGLGAGSVLKVADGNGQYSTLIGPKDGGYVVDARLTRFRIDQNCDNVTGAVVGGDATKAQNALQFGKFHGLTVDDVTFDIGTGINTVTLSGADSTGAVVKDSRFTWGRNLSQPDYDNSAVYITAYDHKVTGNTFKARSVADTARGAIETHGAQSIITGNTITDFRDGINAVPFVGVAPAGDVSNSLVVAGNNLIGGAIGIRLWPATGKVLRNTQVLNNMIVLRLSQWPTFNEPGGIMMAYSVLGNLDGDIDGLTIAGNDIVFESAEARTSGISYGSFAGIGLNGNGNVKNARVYNNTVRNAPFWAYVFGRAGKTVTNLRAWNNLTQNPGTAVGHAPAAARVALNLSGLHTNTRISRLSVEEDTPTAQAYALMTTALTAGSSVRIDGLDIVAPNNPALVVPAPPAGVTFEQAVSTSASNTFTAKQTVNVTGVRAIEGVSDTQPGVFGKSTSGSGTFGQSDIGAGLQGISRVGYGMVAQQQGAATGTVGGGSITAFIQRQIAAGANLVTGSTFVVDDAATVTTGSRPNALAEFRWDGVAKLILSGGSHAMGAGIIQAGGWARASATLDFPSIPAGGQAELTMTVTGAAIGDGVTVGGVPGLEAGLVLGQPRVTAANTVTIRLHNPTAAAIDPATATYTVKVSK